MQCLLCCARHILSLIDLLYGHLQKLKIFISQRYHISKNFRLKKKYWVSKLTYPRLPLYLTVLHIMNGKVCIKFNKLRNKRGITPRNSIKLNFSANMYIYVLFTIKVHEILFSGQKGVALKTVSVVYLNMAKLLS